MRLTPWQSRVAQDPNRFIVISAGRRSGKTFLAMRQICKIASQPNREIFYITSSYRAAKMLVWKTLKNRLLDLRWARKINESELSIELKNGSTISLKGSDNIAALRGVSLSYCVIDEAAYCDPDLFPEVIRPALADQKGGCMFISTPAGTNNYFYDLFQAAKTTPGWSSYSVTTLEGGQVKPEEIEAAKNDMSEIQFKQEFLASFETTQNRIAWAFDRAENVKPLDNPNTSIIYVGLDFNVSPLVATVGVKVTEEIMWVIDEIEIWGSNTNEIAEEIRSRYPNSKVFVFPDPSGSRKQTSSAGKSDHLILEEAGFVVKSPRKHDPVRDRINAINARFCNSKGERRLFISPNCKRTIESLEKHSYKPGTTIPDKDSNYDHMFDALSYKIAFLWPIKKPAPVYQAQTWGIRTL